MTEAGFSPASAARRKSVTKNFEAFCASARRETKGAAIRNIGYILGVEQAERRPLADVQKGQNFGDGLAVDGTGSPRRHGVRPGD